VGREIPGADVTVAGLTGHDYSKPGKPDIAWDDLAARDELVSKLVTDALALLASIDADALTDKQQETSCPARFGRRAGRGTGRGI